MDEIDNIILHSLRQIGCDIDESTSNLNLDPATVIKCISRCLLCIDPSLDVPQSMPAGMAQRYGATLALAEQCIALGFRGDLGYQTFLHSNNVVELRRVLMFLIDRLPKDEAEADGVKELTEREKLDSQMRQNLAMALKSNKKMLPISRALEQGRLDFAGGVSELDPRRSIFLQTTPAKLWSTIITHNDNGSTEDRRPTNSVPRSVSATSITTDKSLGSADGKIESPNKEEEESPPKSDPVAEKRIHLEELRSQIANQQQEKQNLQTKIAEMRKKLDSGKRNLEDLKLQKKIKERTLLVLENPDENLQKLEKMIANSKEKMRRLQDQWQEHRAPLQAQIDAINEEKSEQAGKTKVVVDQIAEARQKQHIIRNEMSANSQLYSQLMSDLGKVNQKIDRSAYTSRILEIIGNIRKQKTDIDKILRDTREVQKDINTVTGKLERQFTVTDDLLFGHAKKDEQSKRAYKLFLKAHADCGELAKSIQDTGKISREIRDLEEQIDSAKTRNTAANLQQVSKDLEEMTSENRKLFEQIRKERAAIYD